MTPDPSKATARPWRVDEHAFSIYSDNVPKGPMRVLDIRGWGYLTGKGLGALGLSDAEGLAVQKANAALICEAVNAFDSHKALIAELCEALRNIASLCDTPGTYTYAQRAAGEIARAILTKAQATLPANGEANG